MQKQAAGPPQSTVFNEGVYTGGTFLRGSHVCGAKPSQGEQLPSISKGQEDAELPSSLLQPTILGWLEGRSIEKGVNSSEAVRRVLEERRGAACS